MEALVIGDICPRWPREENALLERSPDRPARARPRGTSAGRGRADPGRVTYKDSAKLSSSRASIVGAPQSPARGPAASYRARRRAGLLSGPSGLNRIKGPQKAAPAPRPAIARGRGCGSWLGPAPAGLSRGHPASVLGLAVLVAPPPVTMVTRGSSSQSQPQVPGSQAEDCKKWWQSVDSFFLDERMGVKSLRFFTCNL